jgi:hypothetical protein
VYPQSPEAGGFPQKDFSNLLPESLVHAMGEVTVQGPDELIEEAQRPLAKSRRFEWKGERMVGSDQPHACN